MSKSKGKVVRDEDESNIGYRYYQEYRKHKRDKRLDAALKTKNIEELSEFTEEDDYY